MNNQTYTPSNKAPAIGLVVLFFAMTAVGIGIFWLYEIIEGWIPLIYLSILLAVGAGFAVGAVGGKIVKIFKLRSPFLVLLITCLAMLAATYVRAAIYVARDYNKNIYSELKDSTISEVTTGFFSNNEMPLPTEKEDAETMLTIISAGKSINILDTMREAITKMNLGDEGEKLLASYTAITNVLGETYGDIYETLLGSNVEEIMKNSEKMKASPSMSVYEYLYDYRGLQKRDITYLVTHPGGLFSDLKNINTVGRWTIKSHRYGLTDTKNDNIKGFLLWIVWAAEFFILAAIPVGWAYDKSKYPFIESEDEWAEEEKPMPDFKFLPPDNGRPGSEYSVVKAEMLRDPNYLFTLTPVPIIAPIPEVCYKVTYCRSKYFDENYLTVTYSALTNARKNQRRQVQIIKHLKVDADYIATLYGTFECSVPAMCKGENRAKEMSQTNAERKQAAESGRPLSPTPPKATGAEAIFDEPLFNSPRASRPKPEQADDFAAKQLEEERRQAAAARPTSGEMDGIDTSSLDLDKIDLNRM